MGNKIFNDLPPNIKKINSNELLLLFIISIIIIHHV